MPNHFAVRKDKLYILKIHQRMIEPVDVIIEETIHLQKLQNMFVIVYQQKKTVPATLKHAN